MFFGKNSNPKLNEFCSLSGDDRFFYIIVYLLIHQEEYDTHDPKGHSSMVLPFLKKRSKVIEIVSAQDIVFALVQSGVCAAFSRGSDLIR